MAKTLVVDDERLVRVLVREACSRLGHKILEARSLAEGLERAKEGVDLVFLDVMLPDGDGLEQLETFARLPGNPDVVVITGYGDGEGAAGALRSGALDYLGKPLQLRDIERCITQALAWREQRRDKTNSLICPEIIGKSKALLEVLEKLAEAAASDVSLLIQGETGVGKELIAQALHRNSKRRNAPCITLDCASLPSTLLSTQLFGHAKGAFTGADRSREGLLRAAHTGTLFMDEVGELPLDVQASFLRALDVRRFRPVGEKNEVESDFRLVAATNKDLASLVSEGRYRGDLLYRLQGMIIQVPPLRRRLEDLPLLLEHFLGEIARKYGADPKSPDSDVTDALLSYTWPGNVRELYHVARNAWITAGNSEALHIHHLPQDLRIAVSKRKFQQESRTKVSPLYTREQAGFVPPSPGMAFAGELPTLKQCRHETESRYLEELLIRSRGDMSRAARLAGVSRGHLYELMRKHGRG